MGKLRCANAVRRRNERGDFPQQSQIICSAFKLVSNDERAMKDRGGELREWDMDLAVQCFL